jgi:hypothetical protein
MEPISVEEYEAFLVKNRDPYLRRFVRFDSLAGNFAATWHWYAFGFGPWWLLYRKLYLWAVAAFILTCIPVTALPVHIACGVAGYYLTYLRARKTILSLREAYPGQDIHAKCMDLGGVNLWIAVAAAIVCFIALVALAFTGMLTFMFTRSGASWV